MYKRFERLVLAALKVPPRPQPPAGDPTSLKVFKAGRNYWRLKLAKWSIAQFIALAGLIFWTTVLIDVEKRAAEQNANGETAQQRAGRSRVRGAVERLSRAATGFKPGEQAHSKKGTKVQGWAAFKQFWVELSVLLPVGGFAWVWVLKILGFVVYLAQIPITYAVLRFDYDMRWYMVTDRSLRLRSGVWKISEATMSFANIQQVVVSQGPLQRLLGLADVKVKSAGGGQGGHQSHAGADMHTGAFHAVTNAVEIRDLILERLKSFRDAGLGDPDERKTANAGIAGSGAGNRTGISAAALQAARELAEEAKALRTALRS